VPESPQPLRVLSVVIPAQNEESCIAATVEHLYVELRLRSIEHEIVVVDDDSPDLTWKVAAEGTGADDHRVRVLRRIERRGLGNSVIDGFKNSQGDALACIDADLQHDPAIIPQMLAALEQGADMVMASRYVEGGGTGEWGLMRLAGSRFATWLAKLMLGIRIQDPMSGYFMVRREGFYRVLDQLNGDGFKIMLELLVHLKPRNIVEVPYTFRTRLAGESKLSSTVIFNYLAQLCRLSGSAGRLPYRLLKFAIVGGIGTVVNLTVMAWLIHFTSLRDWRASAASTFAAVCNNFFVNNAWTFGDRMIRGLKLFKGYASYLLMSLAGLVVTTTVYATVTSWLSSSFRVPPTASTSDSILILVQLISISFGTYTNYVLNKRFTWGPRGSEVTAPEVPRVQGRDAGRSNQAA